MTFFASRPHALRIAALFAPALVGCSGIPLPDVAAEANGVDGTLLFTPLRGGDTSRIPAGAVTRMMVNRYPGGPSTCPIGPAPEQRRPGDTVKVRSGGVGVKGTPCDEGTRPDPIGLSNATATCSPSPCTVTLLPEASAEEVVLELRSPLPGAYTLSVEARGADGATYRDRFPVGVDAPSLQVPRADALDLDLPLASGLTVRLDPPRLQAYGATVAELEVVSVEGRAAASVDASRVLRAGVPGTAVVAARLVNPPLATDPERPILAQEVTRTVRVADASTRPESLRLVRSFEVDRDTGHPARTGYVELVGAASTVAEKVIVGAVAHYPDGRDVLVPARFTTEGSEAPVTSVRPTATGQQVGASYLGLAASHTFVLGTP